MKRDGACLSLWQDTTETYHPVERQQTNSFDVIIAGAGVTGLTLGLKL